MSAQKNKLAYIIMQQLEFNKTRIEGFKRDIKRLKASKKYKQKASDTIASVKERKYLMKQVKEYNSELKKILKLKNEYKMAKKLEKVNEKFEKKYSSKQYKM